MDTVQRTIKKSVKYHFGFTIVELLVVIVVIGVLASISLVSYVGISAKAIDASITTDLNNVFKKFKIHQVENGGYPTTIDCSTANSATNICLKPSPNNQYTLTTDNSVASNQYFCVSILNTASNKRSYITNDGKQTQGPCPYILTLIAGAGGGVIGGGAYDPGTTQTITATPNTYYEFSSWTGDTGCSGAVSHSITMDGNKTCTANFITNWIDGVVATVMAGKKVRNANLSVAYPYKTSDTAVTSPQGATGLDPNYPTKMSLVSPQVNPSVDFSEYPAQNACKGIGGRLPNMQELLAIYANRATYGNNFSTVNYRSSTETDSTFVYLVSFNNGSWQSYSKTPAYSVRCVAD